MDRYSAMVAICGMITGAITIAIVAQAWASRGRRKDDPSLAGNRLGAIEHKLSEMQQSLDAVAVEVERISEAQRFTTRLLTERAAAESK